MKHKKNEQLESAVNHIPEYADHIFNHQTQLSKRIDERNCIKGLKISEEYFQGRIAVLVVLDQAVGGDIVDNSSSPMLPYGNTAIHRSPNLTVWISDFDFANFRQIKDWSNELVLISNIGMMQSKDRFSTPAFICFEGEEEFDRVTMGRFYSVTRGFVSGLGEANREGRIAASFTSVDPKQFPCGMVKSGSMIVNSISNDKRDLWRYRIADIQLNELGSIGVFANNKSCSVSLTKDIENSFQLIDVLIGPLDFEKGTIKPAACLSTHGGSG